MSKTKKAAKKMAKAIKKYDLDYDQSRDAIRRAREMCGLYAPKRKKRAVEPFTRAELEAIFETAKEHSHQRYLMMRCLYESGARIGAFSRIQVEDCYFDQALIQLRITKNAKSRVVPITGELADMLADHAQHGLPSLFNSERGEAYSKRRLQQIITDTGKAAGVTSGCHAHKFRKTRGSFLANNGFGLAEVQEFLGHENPTTTSMHYVKIDTQRMGRLVEEAEVNARRPLRRAA